MDIQIYFIFGVLLIIVSILLVFSFFIDLFKAYKTKEKINKYEKSLPKKENRLQDHKDKSLFETYLTNEQDVIQALNENKLNTSETQESKKSTYTFYKGHEKSKKPLIKPVEEKTLEKSVHHTLHTHELKDRISVLFQSGLSSHDIAIALNISENEVLMVMNLNNMVRSKF